MEHIARFVVVVVVVDSSTRRQHHKGPPVRSCRVTSLGICVNSPPAMVRRNIGHQKVERTKRRFCVKLVYSLKRVLMVMVLTGLDPN